MITDFEGPEDPEETRNYLQALNCIAEGHAALYRGLAAAERSEEPTRSELLAQADKCEANILDLQTRLPALKEASDRALLAAWKAKARRAVCDVDTAGNPPETVEYVRHLDFLVEASATLKSALNKEPANDTERAVMLADADQLQASIDDVAARLPALRAASYEALARLTAERVKRDAQAAKDGPSVN